jgi:uncharacterized protein (TIGR03435 family)
MRWLVLTIVAIAIHAQAPPAFEVASVRPSDESNKKPTGWNYDRGLVTYSRANLKVLVMDAYQVAYYQIEAPPWFETQHYDVSAKIPEGSSQDQLPAMLQALLAERFHMALHWETRTEPAFALIANKGGPKLVHSDEPGDHAVKSSNGHFEWQRTTVGEFARTLSGLTGRPVMDQTGIDGKFNIALELNATDLAGLRGSDPGDENPAGRSIFTALQGIGLKLDARKLPVRHLVIDHADRVPVEN